MANDLKIQIIGTLNSTATLEQINRSIAQLESRLNRININVQVSSNTQAALNSLNSQLRNLGSNNVAQNINNQMSNLGNSINQASNHATRFGSALSEAFQKFPVWLISGTAIMQTINFFKDGVTFANQLNQSLTEISIVTGQNQDQVAALGEQYNKLAQQMGVTTNEVAGTAASLARQGLSMDEATSRMKTVIEYAKISSLDINTANEIMTSAINSMGVSAKRAADVWSYLGDATSTGADEIGKAMQRVGGTAGALGLNFEKVSSWIAEISSRTRESAETIGNSIKSILARVQSLKETGYDSTDNTSVNQVSKALASVNIQLMNSQGQWNNFADVLDQLGNKWKSLDSRTKSYLATTIAGTYQQSR